MTAPRVLNLRRDGMPSGSAYVGRKRHGRHYGNPFSNRAGTLAAVRVETPAEALVAFREWLDGTAHHDVEPDRRRWILANLEQLRGRDLVCYCSPRPCHAEVLRDLANGPDPLDETMRYRPPQATAR